MRTSSRWLVLLGLGIAGCGAPPPASLTVTVDPPEGRIFLEGEFLGVGRGEARDLQAPFTYHLRVDPPPGFVVLSQEVPLAAGEARQLSLRLERIEAARAQEERRRAEARTWAGDPSLPEVSLETSMGTVTLRLFEDDAPNTVANFVALADRGFLDGTLFHRVIPGFMIQGGDPLSRNQDPHDDGTGGPGYAFPDEFSSKLHASEGILSMANAGPGTNGSQFFLTLGPTPHLNGRHTVFGIVSEGMDVVQAIGRVTTLAGDRPREPVVLERVVVRSRRDHPYVPVDARGRPLPLPPARR